MIRVIYDWQVQQENISGFRHAWEQATTGIHAKFRGARGSFLLQAADEPGRILTIARWDTREDWEAFWEQSKPEEMAVMQCLGECINVTVFDEYADFTV